MCINGRSGSRYRGGLEQIFFDCLRILQEVLGIKTLNVSIVVKGANR